MCQKKETSEKNQKKLKLFDLNGRIERLGVMRGRGNSYSFFFFKKPRIRDFFWLLMRVENMQVCCQNSTRKEKHIFLAILKAVYASDNNCVHSFNKYVLNVFHRKVHCQVLIPVWIQKTKPGTRYKVSSQFCDFL